MLANHHAIFLSHHLPSLHHVTASHRVPLRNPDSDNSSWDVNSEPGHQDTKRFRDIAAISQPFTDKMTEHMITGEICFQDYCKMWFACHYIQWYRFEINTAHQYNFKHVKIIGYIVFINLIIKMIRYIIHVCIFTFLDNALTAIIKVGHFNFKSNNFSYVTVLYLILCMK